MATYYLDYEGGNDANAGTSFALRWKTLTLGATAARIAPGDTIRVMASPSPTSLGNGTWTGGGRLAAKNISSSTNATPIVVTCNSHGYSTGDTVSILGHTTNTNANGIWRVGTTTTNTFQLLQLDGSNTTGNGVGGATGNVTKINNCVVKLASPVTKNIALCGGLGQKPTWTASANVTATQNTTDYKEGYSSASLAVAAAFTTGKAAYYTLPASLDLSGFQQVCFWIKQTSGTIGAAGAVYLALCSDTTGGTVVHTCNVPAIGALNVWVPVVVNLATNLNAGVQSVAFYVVTDNGAQTFLIDNIFAAKASSSADSLNLTSLISKSDGTGDEAWYALQSVNYDVAVIANANIVVSTNTFLRGYNGATETVTTYKRETIKTTPAASSTATVQEVMDSGTAGSLITFSGGWNRTDMSTQTGQTWFDGLNCNGRGVFISGKNFVAVDRINFCRYQNGLYNVNGASLAVGSIYATACNESGVHIQGLDCTITNIWANNCGGAANNYGLAITTTAAGARIGTVKCSDNCGDAGVFITSTECMTIDTLFGGNSSTNTNSGSLYVTNSSRITIGSCSLTNNQAAPGIYVNAGEVFINGGSTTGFIAGATVAGPTDLFLNNFTINEATEVTAITFGRGTTVFSNRHDNTDGNNWQWQGSGTINQQTSVVDSPATTSWKMNPTTASATGTAAPLTLKLGTVVCAAGALVTVTARMRRDNTGLTMRLVCPGGQISGVTSDVTSDMTAAANTWETVTITFTPTKAGGVDIYAYAFGGTTYSGYVCNLTASQA